MKAKTKMGEIGTSQIRLVRWQQQAEWRGTGINFAETSGQRRPDENMLREEGRVFNRLGAMMSELVPTRERTNLLPSR